MTVEKLTLKGFMPLRKLGQGQQRIPVPPARSRSRHAEPSPRARGASGLGGDNSSAGRAGSGGRGRARPRPRYLLGAGDPRDAAAHHSEPAPRRAAGPRHRPARPPQPLLPATAAVTAPGHRSYSSRPPPPPLPVTAATAPGHRSRPRRLHLRRAAAPKLPRHPRGGGGRESPRMHRNGFSPPIRCSCNVCAASAVHLRAKDGDQTPSCAPVLDFSLGGALLSLLGYICEFTAFSPRT